MESYSTPGFAELFDAMVEKLPPELGVGQDVEQAAAATQELLQRRAPVRVLDLCCGSGRIALGLRAACSAAAADAAARHSIHPALTVLGVDSSEEMLSAAKRRAAEEDASARGRGAATNGGAPCAVAWAHGDVSTLDAIPELSTWRGACDLAIIGGCSFHHLTTEAEQLACLRGVAALLRCSGAGAGSSSSNGNSSSCGGDGSPGGVLLLDLLPPAALQAELGRPRKYGSYVRTCLLETRHVQDDGGVVLRQRFWLERYNSGVRANCHNEQWALREVSPEQLRTVAAAAGLCLVQQQARWGGCGCGGRGGSEDGCGEDGCSDEDARVFVLALDPSSSG